MCIVSVHRRCRDIHTVIYPIETASKPSIWFGCKTVGMDTKQIKTESYSHGIDERYWKVKGKMDAYASDFEYYRVTSYENLEVGQSVIFDNRKMYILEKRCKLKNSVLEFEYIVCVVALQVLNEGLLDLTTRGYQRNGSGSSSSEAEKSDEGAEISESGVNIRGAGDESGSKTGAGEYVAPGGGGGVTSTIKVNGRTVNFGHGGRHLEGTGLSVDTVNQALANEVSVLNLGTGQFHKGQIIVDGITIEYTSYGVSEGIINVGTYYPLQ